MPGVEWAVWQPHPRLRGLVSRYLGYAQHDVTLGVHRGLPSRHVTLIISLAEPIRLVGMPRPGEAPADLIAAVGGMHVRPVLIRQDRFQSGIHVELDPLGVPALFGVSSAELSEHVVDLADLSPRLAGLPGRLAAAGGWTRRFEILDEVLSAGAAERAPAPEVDWAWQRMRRSGGRIRIGTLAEEVGWSRRHFTERFGRELGLAPKQAARILRFERANALVRQGRLDLAGLAVDCGYYDQAHLTNDWHALAGCPPSVWIAEELPFLQDDGSTADANSAV
ncbi:helix-turn-helix domain-containing protein [Amycolatopsis acidiphila]|uniref:AraC family transcriptional regulator n=1 Tax=Amycolatopsis acidiphila TaxID=715473 RepID=A0A558ADA2_9PSEU|nr:helix-turn-helix domain-containing protein [Amycolatopsis acidiphila]TVT22183.1 AraC family transcriptional regulator [Amycolatopsis acidiphila]UIJ61618.1 helix-turn-helix domain-containing protein [Amycolatopsis acidiphila]GHG58871.1 AraC family transcriptional regulator [Amycolatopsis acidiphila]